jgi:Flp pilus assembly pilin Flp
MKMSTYLKNSTLFPTKSMMRNAKGAAITEYAILAGLVGVTAIATVFSLGERIDTAYVSFKDKISNPVTAGGGSTPPSPPADPFAVPSPYHGTGSCTTYTAGNDNETSDNAIECYSFLTGADIFDASSHQTGVSVYTDASPDSLNPDAPDTITLSAFNDYFVGHGRSTITAGAGDDVIDLTLERNSVGHTIDLGDGNDFLKIKATDFDGTEAGMIEIKTQMGNDTADLVCNDNKRPNYTFRLKDQAKLRTSCETDVRFEGWPIDVILDAEFSAANVVMDSTKTNFWAPGIVDVNLKINDANHRMHVSDDLSGTISVVGGGGANPGDLTLWLKAPTAQPNLDFNVTGTFGMVDISFEDGKNNAWNMDLTATEESILIYKLGTRSASTGFPSVKINGGGVQSKLRFDGWKNAPSDDLTLSFLRSDGSTYKTYDMAAPDSNTTLEFFDPQPEGITKAVIARGADSFEIPFNTAGSGLDIRQLIVYFDTP